MMRPRAVGCRCATLPAASVLALLLGPGAAPPARADEPQPPPAAKTLVLSPTTGIYAGEPPAPPPVPGPPTAAGAPSAGTPAGGTPSSQIAAGLALELGLGTDVSAIGGGGAQAPPVGLRQGGIFVGRKSGRTIFGVALELSRISESSSSTSRTDVLLAPGGRWVLTRSADQRAELFGELDLGFGYTFLTGSSVNGELHLMAQVAPGLRYWVHPNIAFGAIAGLRGDYSFADISGNSSTLAITTLFTRLQLTGVF